MKFRFSIVRRLTFGFGILTLAVIVSIISMYTTLNSNIQISDELRNTYSPSVTSLNNLYVLVNNSKMLIKNWVYDKVEDTPEKLALKDLHTTGIKRVEKNLLPLMEKWQANDRDELKAILVLIKDSLFAEHQYVMTRLVTFENYQDPQITFDMEDRISQGGSIIAMSDRILARLNILVKSIEKQADDRTAQMVESFDAFQRNIVILGLVLLLAALTIAWVTTKSIINPVNSLKRILLQMQKGVLPAHKLHITNDEIGEMANALNMFIDSLKKTSEFSLEIGKGNFDMAFKPLSGEDILGNSLIAMRENLREAAKKEDLRKKEDDQRNWGTRGLAMFGDILRQNNDNIEELAYNIISNLVKYTGAIQGGMFILNDDDPADIHLEMKAAYAYDRRKFAQKRVAKGEGLVGTCLIEKHTIYMTDVPDSYVYITSGLGKSNPRCILIVPLKANDEIFGVIEMAAFNRLEKYQIEFVEKVAESIASTISSVKINTRTALLLRESKEQGEQLIQQEEEMRQNLEELQATQEEAERRITELEKNLTLYEESVGMFEIDMEGKILHSNERFAAYLLTSPAQLIGKSQFALLATEQQSQGKFAELVSNLQDGIRQTLDNVYTTPKGKVILRETYHPVKHELGDFSRIVVVATEISRTTY